MKRARTEERSSATFAHADLERFRRSPAGDASVRPWTCSVPSRGSPIPSRTRLHSHRADVPADSGDVRFGPLWTTSRKPLGERIRAGTRRCQLRAGRNPGREGRPHGTRSFRNGHHRSRPAVKLDTVRAAGWKIPLGRKTFFRERREGVLGSAFRRRGRGAGRESGKIQAELFSGLRVLPRCPRGKRGRRPAPT